VKLAIRAALVGSVALWLAVPSLASVVTDAFRQVAGVNANLAAQVAEVVRTPPKTMVVSAPVAAPAPGQTVTVVTPDAREKLLQSIGDFSLSSARNAQKSAAIVLGFVVAAIGLGVAASIAGFCKWSALAGILSILATATVGANNALPFRDQANTYKYVSAEAGALLTRARLDLQMTQEQYGKYTDQLLKLATYGDDKSVSGSAEDLTKFLQNLHSPSGGA